MVDHSPDPHASLLAEIDRLRARLADAEGPPARAQPPSSGQDSLIEYVQDAVLLTGVDFRIRRWNAAAARLYGWQEREVLGRTIHEVIPTLRYLDGGDEDEAREALIQRGHWRGEVVQPHRDGHELFVDASVQPLRAAGGEAEAYVAINRDIGVQRRAKDELQRYAERLRLIHSIDQGTLSAQQPWVIANQALGMLRQQVAAQHASILLYDHDGGGSRLFATSADTPSVFVTDLRVDLSAADRSAAFRSGQIWRSDDLQAESASTPLLEQLISEGFRSAMSIPLIAGELLIGGLNLLSTSLSAFGPSQIDVAREVANHLAIAIQSARLRASEERARHITEVLYQAGLAISRSLNLNEVLETLLECLQRLVPYDSANVMLLHEQWIFQIYSQRGYQDRGGGEMLKSVAFDAREHTVTGTILASQRSLVIADTSSYPGWVELSGGEDVRSWMGVPIIARGEVLGIYALNKATPGFFTPEMAQLAETLSTVAATAITNALLYTQAQDELSQRRRAERELEAERALLARRVAERTADLSAANAELARAARLKDEFLANMSHELRTPLNTVLGRTEILREQIYGPLSERQQHALQSIDESGRHLLSLINDILDLSKIEAGKLDLQFDVIAVDEICRSSLRMIAQAAAFKQITINSSFDLAVEQIRADERRLRQILVNLLANAVKFTPTGGKIGLEVRGDARRRTVTFTVWDSGIGIAAAHLPMLFRPFVQIDSSLTRQHEGTGLGLALVLRLTEAHGGSVSVESTPGEGSRFNIVLDWPDLSAAAWPQLGPTERPPLFAALRRALLIEDSSATAEQLVRYLDDLGCAVTIYDRGIGAVERAVELAPDLILLDVLLPDQSGWEVLGQLKANPRTADIPVLVVSVVDEPEMARRFGAAAALLKPIAREDLLRALHQAAPAEAAPAGDRPHASAPADGPLLLVAENNEENINLLLDTLPVAGYRVALARNGHEALALAREARPAAILMDIQMPGMDGLEATRRIRADAALRDIPVVAVTALAMPGDRERCLEAGADAYLMKPVSLRELPAIIEEVIRRRAG